MEACPVVIADHEVRPLALAHDYPSLHRVLRERREALGIRFSSIDEAGLLPDGQSSKLLSLVPRRSVLGPLSLGGILQALGVELLVVESPRAMAYAARHWEKRDERVVRSVPVRPTTVKKMMAL